MCCIWLLFVPDFFYPSASQRPAAQPSINAACIRHHVVLTLFSVACLSCSRCALFVPRSNCSVPDHLDMSAHHTTPHQPSRLQPATRRTDCILPQLAAHRSPFSHASACLFCYVLVCVCRAGWQYLVQPEHCPSHRPTKKSITVNLFANNGIATQNHDLTDLSGPTVVTNGVNGKFVKLECNGKPLCEKTNKKW